MKLPPRDAFPGVGTIERAALRRGLDELRAFELTEDDVPSKDRSMREGVCASVSEIGEWLEAAQARPGAGLVSFYY